MRKSSIQFKKFSAEFKHFFRNVSRSFGHIVNRFFSYKKSTTVNENVLHVFANDIIFTHTYKVVIRYYQLINFITFEAKVLSYESFCRNFFL